MSAEALERLLADLVAIDTTSTRSNLPVLDTLERRLTAAGLACARHRYVDEAGVEKANLLAALGEGPSALTLVGHTDCVPADPAWTDAFRLTERDGQLFGRGACDTKGWLAAMVVAAEATRTRVRRPLLLVFTADEELGCVGAKRLVAERPFPCARAIVGEPTRLTPVRASKGYCLAEVEVHGRSGHSAYPEAGASAVVRAARLIDRLDAWARGPLRLEADPAFSPPFATVNVGRISGGRATNVIPDRCRFSLEWRPLPDQPLDGVLRALERLRDELAAGDPDLHVTVSVPRLDRGFDTPPDAEVVELLSRAVGRPAQTVAFGTEGPQLASLGAQVCVFGPGDIATAHQTGEHVSRAELRRAAEVLETAILHFCAA